MNLLVMKANVYPLTNYLTYIHLEFYEAYFCEEPWPIISMQLLDAVRCGQQPITPENTSEGVKSIIREC